MTRPEFHYEQLLRLVDTRDAGAGFPDMLSPPVQPDRLAEFGLSCVKEHELIALRRLRDGLAEGVLGAGGTAERVVGLNSLVRWYRLTPRLTADGGVRHVSGRAGRVARLAEVVLAQALQLVSSGDVRRLAVCASSDCAAPFVSVRRGGPRSYCSSRCAGRERVRRFRDSAPDSTSAERTAADRGVAR